MERPSGDDGQDRVDQVALGLFEDDAEHVHDDVLSALLQPHSMRLVGAGDLDGATGSSQSFGERFEVGMGFIGVVVVERYQAHEWIRPQGADG